MIIYSYERVFIRIMGKRYIMSNQCCKVTDTLGGIDASKLDNMCDFFKVIADRTRLRILIALLGGNLCVMHISEAVGMSQSATSHQLAILRRANLVKASRSGKTLIYSIADEHVRLILDMTLLHMNEKE